MRKHRFKEQVAELMVSHLTRWICASCYRWVYIVIFIIEHPRF